MLYLIIIYFYHVLVIDPSPGFEDEKSGGSIYVHYE